MGPMVQQVVFMLKAVWNVWLFLGTGSIAGSSTIVEEKMKRLVRAISVAILAFAVGARPQTPHQAKPGPAEQELLKLVRDWMDAEVRADMAFLDQFLAEDWVATDPVGTVWTKAQFLEGLKSGEGAVLSFALDNMKVRVYGEAAVMTGRMTAKQRFQGQDISGQYQCTDMFIKKAGRWQCVATHLSMIAQK